MAFQEKSVLKGYFETSDIPTQTHFSDLIDSMKAIGYASIYVETNSTATTIASSSTDFSNKVQVTIFDTNGAASDATPDHTNDHITIGEAGDYDIVATVSFSGANSATYSLGIFKNNGATQLGPRTTRKLGTGGDVGACVVASGVVTLAAADTVELWIQNEGGTGDPTVQDSILSVTRE